MNEPYLTAIYHHAPDNQFIAYRSGLDDATSRDLAPERRFDNRFVAYPSGIDITTNNDWSYFNPLGMYS